MPRTDAPTESAGQSEQQTGESETKLMAVKTNPLFQWILVNGNRWVVSAVALALVGIGFVGSGLVGGTRDAVHGGTSNSDDYYRAF